MSKPTTLTIAARKSHVEIAGLSLAEAQELFGKNKASEGWGTVRVTETKPAAIRAALRDAGYRTKVAS